MCMYIYIWILHGILYSVSTCNMFANPFRHLAWAAGSLDCFRSAVMTRPEVLRQGMQCPDFDARRARSFKKIQKDSRDSSSQPEQKTRGKLGKGIGGLSM